MEDQNKKDEIIVSKVCDALDDSVQRIDAETLHRITEARQTALAKAPKHFSLKNFSMPKLFTAAATAMSLFIAVMIVNTQFNQSIENESVEEIELIASQDTLDLYEELEFYTWLVEEDGTG